MVTPETPETLYTMCSYWARIIKTKGENGVHIWPACESAFYRIRQFLENSALQHEVLGDIESRLFLIDGYEQEIVNFDDLQTQIGESLEFTQEQSFSFENWLSQQSNQFVTFFLVGFDTSLQQNNTIALQRLTALQNRYANLDFTLILFTELNIVDSEIYSLLFRTTNLLQNVQYQPLFKDEDIRQFTHYIETQWNMSVPVNILESFVCDVGGHFLLIKEGIRLVRDTPGITKDALFSAPSMIRKGITIFERLATKDKETIRLVLQKKTPLTSEYLLETRLVKDARVGLAYWQHIADTILTSSSNTYSHTLEFYFTSAERDVFDLLLESKIVVSRTKIAEKIWHEGWEEKYSDWAIDQMMHRIREKLTLTNSVYQIRTKKGEGFILKSID